MGAATFYRTCGLFAAVGAISACQPASPPVTAPTPSNAQGTAGSGRAASDQAAIERARMDSARYPYVAADIQFMSKMIGHHRQAIEMSRMVPSRTTSPSIRTLAARIINAQQDEIHIMEQWLRDRRQPLPDSASMAAHQHMGHEMPMPGMLTAAQLKQMADSKGEDFDRLFLRNMIEHHRGAVTMVEQLFATPGAAQDLTVFKLASDVQVDQTTEVARMTDMLVTLLFGRPPAEARQ